MCKCALTSIGIDALAEDTQRQHGVDECEQAGGRRVGRQQRGRVGGHDAVRHTHSIGYRSHGDRDAQVAAGAVSSQTHAFRCGTCATDEPLVLMLTSNQSYMRTEAQLSKLRTGVAKKRRVR